MEPKIIALIPVCVCTYVFLFALTKIQSMHSQGVRANRREMNFFKIAGGATLTSLVVLGIVIVLTGA